jgi:hypothetical protein
VTKLDFIARLFGDGPFNDSRPTYSDIAIAFALTESHSYFKRVPPGIRQVPGSERNGPPTYDVYQEQPFRQFLVIYSTREWVEALDAFVVRRDMVQW